MGTWGSPGAPPLFSAEPAIPSSRRWGVPSCATGFRVYRHYPVQITLDVVPIAVIVNDSVAALEEVLARERGSVLFLFQKRPAFSVIFTSSSSSSYMNHRLLTTTGIHDTTSARTNNLNF